MSDSMTIRTDRCALLVPVLPQTAVADLVRMLAKLGAREPRSLQGSGSAGDGVGWLSARIEQFHAQLRDEFGDSVIEQGRAGDDWALGERFASSLPGLLEQEYEDARLPILASPGLSQFLPCWLQALHEMRIAPKIIVPIPQPTEMAGLASQDGLAGIEGDSMTGLKRLLDIEWQTRGFDRVLVPGDEFLDDWREWAHRISSELDVRWPIPPATVDLGVDRVANPGPDGPDGFGQRHAPDLPAGLVSMAHDALRRIASGGSSGLEAEYIVLDRIRHVLDPERASGPGSACANAITGTAAGDPKASRAVVADSDGMPGQRQVYGTEGNIPGEQARLEDLLISCRRELAQVRSKQEALMEQASMLPKVRIERDAISGHLAKRLSASYWQETSISAADLRRSLRRWLGRILRSGHSGTRSHGSQQRWESIRMIEASPLFDGGWYLREYEDVAASDISPAEHYLLSGAAEGRNPGPAFDTVYYLTRHPDVSDSGINPLVHYISNSADEIGPIGPDAK